MARYVIEFDSAEELASFVAQRTGPANDTGLRYALANHLPQTVKVKATPSQDASGPIIVLNVLSRGTESDDLTIDVPSGSSVVV